MITVNHPCQNCMHFKSKINGLQCACEAFPEGIPPRHMMQKDVTKLKECNNNIKYEALEK